LNPRAPKGTVLQTVVTNRQLRHPDIFLAAVAAILFYEYIYLSTNPNVNKKHYSQFCLACSYFVVLAIFQSPNQLLWSRELPLYLIQRILAY